MVDVFLVNGSNRELRLFSDGILKIASRISDAQWNFSAFSEPAKSIKYLNDGGAVDFASVDVVLSDGICAAESVRKANKSAFIMLVADSTVSPVTYLKPTVIPGALLLRPFSAEQFKRTLSDSLKRFSESVSEDNDGMFQLVLKNERKLIPYSQIYYFEAREKKIYLNTGNQEYSFYDTIEHLCENLPQGFLQCHRSFLVSKSKIANVYLSKNYVELDNGCTVPLSRSFKGAIKELK